MQLSPAQGSPANLRGSLQLAHFIFPEGFGANMSYDQSLLFNKIFLSIRQKPLCLLADLCQELGISRGTIEKVIYVATGKTFRRFREGIILESAIALLVSSPTSSIKQISVDLGFRSPRSFARAMRRTCGLSPEQLRSGPARELCHQMNSIESRMSRGY